MVIKRKRYESYSSIEEAVKSGYCVYWKESLYEVVRESLSNVYMIRCMTTGVYGSSIYVYELKDFYTNV